MEKPKLLIIDDDEALFESLIDIIELEGYVTETAHTGMDGIKKVRSAFYNIVLLDMKLPDSDGIEVLEKIKEISSDTEVIMFTAYAAADTVINAMDRNAFSYLPKPFEAQELISTLKKACDKQAITLENKKLLSHLKTLNTISQIMAESLNIEKTLLKVLEEVFALGGFHIGIVCEYLGGKHNSMVSMGLSKKFLHEVAGKARDDTLCGYTFGINDRVAIEKHLPEYVVKEGLPNETVAEVTAQTITREGFESYFGFPIRHKQEAVAVLSLFDTRPRKISSDMLELITSICNQLGSSIENNKLFQKVYDSKKDWETTFDSISDLISIHDEDSNIIKCNNALVHKLNVKHKDIMGKKCYEVYHGRNEPLPDCPFLRSKERLKPSQLEIECMGVIFTMSCYPRLDNSGRFCGAVHIASDITERKLAEKRIEHLASFPQLNINPILEVNQSGEIVFYNDATLNIIRKLGLKEDLNIFLPENINEIFNDLKRKKKVLSFHEVKIGSLIFEENIYYVSTFNVLRIYTRDITERKEAEVILQESEERFRGTFQQAAVGIAHIAPNGQFLRINKRFCYITGYTEGDLLKMTFQDITHADDLNADLNLMQQILDERIKTYTLEKRYIKKDGSIFWINLTVSLVHDISGKPKFFISVIEDITKRKQAEQALLESEEKFRIISSTANDAIIMIDNGGNISFWNNAAERIFGFSKGEIIGKAIHETIIPASLRRSHIKGFNSFKDTGQGAVVGKTVELNAIKKDGTEFPMELSLSAVNIDSKWNAIGIIRNITERKQAEKELEEYRNHLESLVNERTRELRDSQEALVRSEKLAILGKFAGGVGHELRNPLGVINNSVYFLKMVLTDADDKVREYLEKISSEVKLSTDIISALMDFSHAEPVIEKEEVAVTNMLTAALERQPVPKNIEVQTDIPSDLPAVYVDPKMIRQVLLNLIINGYQAMPEGGRLTITASAEKQYVNISIADTGTGISPENIDKIFEPLFSTKARGIGFGLALSKSLVETNGGSIEAKSEKGKGAAFTLKLPVREAVS